MAHLAGILAGSDPAAYGVREVHVWAYEALNGALPERPWLVKHSPPVLRKSLARQLWWQYWVLPREARAAGCDVLFNTDAGSVCRFNPAVTLSQDMLSYEPGEMTRFRFSLPWLRLLLLRDIQSRSLRRAAGAIFLTQYAAAAIQKVIGPLTSFVVIPHGVGDEFCMPLSARTWPAAPEAQIKCLYVSQTALYKHQWNVVRAVAQVRRAGHNVSLLLVGGGGGRAKRLLEQAVAEVDPRREYVSQESFTPHNEIPRLLAEADVFVFASSCENLPITLLEAMASGLPIACSDRGPMPEVLIDGGVYFDPEDVDSIAMAIQTLLENTALREMRRARARELADRYSWEECSRRTWQFLFSCALESRRAGQGTRRPG